MGFHNNLTLKCVTVTVVNIEADKLTPIGASGGGHKDSEFISTSGELVVSEMLRTSMVMGEPISQRTVKGSLVDTGSAEVTWFSHY